MRSLLFASLFLTCTVVCHAQSTDSRFQYGFSLGVHQSNIIAEADLAPGASIANRPGFRLGILADYNVYKLLSIAPKAELAFNGGEIRVPDGNTAVEDDQIAFDVMPVTLEFMTHFVLKKRNGKPTPYFLIGPNVKIPLTQEDETIPSIQGNDLAIDLGIGFDKPLSHFHFIPELRYSFGLLNVYDVENGPAVNHHNIVLAFQFSGS